MSRLRTVTCICCKSLASSCIIYLIDIFCAVTASGSHLPASESVYFLQAVNHPLQGCAFAVFQK